MKKQILESIRLSVFKAVWSMIIVFALIIVLQSCKKDEPCNCGTIANDGIDGDCYWLEIRNDCSGNNKKFCFDEDVWMSNYVGSNFCVSNEAEW